MTPSHSKEAIELFVRAQESLFVPNSRGELHSADIIRSALLDFVKNAPASPDGTSNILNYIRKKAPISLFTLSCVEFYVRFYRFQRVPIDATLVRRIAKRSLKAKAPKIVPTAASQVHALLLQESEKRSRSFAGERTRAIIFLLLHLPLRRGTVCELDLSDYSGGVLTISAPKIKTRTAATVDLSPEVIDRLDAYLLIRGSAPGPLFPATSAGGRLAPTSLSKQIFRVTTKWLSQNNQKGLSIHGFRHLVATRTATECDEGAAKALLMVSADKTLRFYNLSTGGMRAGAAMRRVSEISRRPSL